MEGTVMPSSCKSQDKRTACSVDCDAENKSGWINMDSSSKIPPNAVIAGHISDGSLVYVGRYIDDDQIIPGKVLQKDKLIYFASNNDGEAELSKNKYEILTGSKYGWISWHGGLVPPNAVIGGNNEEGDDFYIGRGMADGELAVGTISPLANPLDYCMHLPVNGTVHKLRTYEVLVFTTKNEDAKACSPCTHNSTWTRSHGKCRLKNAVPICDGDSSGFVGRGTYKGEYFPAAISQDKSSAYVCHYRLKGTTSEFEILTGKEYRWEKAENGCVPLCAVEGGRTTHGEPLYIGRKYYWDEMRMGIVQQSYGCMFIAVDDVAVPVKSYEVLVYSNHKCPGCSE